MDIDDVVIGTYPGCSKPDHRLEMFGMMEALAMGHRWEGSTRMDCGCVNRLFPVPHSPAVFDEWARAIKSGVELIDES